MPAGVGYATTINLAAELTNPQPQPAEVARKVAEDANRGEEAREATTQQRRELAAAGGSTDSQNNGSSSDQGSTTADRGQNVNLVA